MTKSTDTHLRDSNTWTDLFGSPLTQLSQLGLNRPSHLTVGRFLRLLVEEGLLAEDAVTSYVDLLHEYQYAGLELTTESARPVVAALERCVGELAPDNPDLLSLIERLTPPPPSQPDPEPEDVSHEDLGEEDGSDLDVDAPESSVEKSTLRLGRRQWAAVAGMMLLWSVAMFCIGQWGSEITSWSMGQIRHHVLGRPRVYDQLRMLRWQAIRNPDSAGVWRTYADTAERQGHSEEAVSALRHLVIRHPQDAQLLNSLAWLLCTAEARHVRDPVEALELAERAHALDPTPNIIDTLAEAAYQNGDFERAVELEQGVLAQTGGDNEFFKQQLEKFRRAAERAEQR